MCRQALAFWCYALLLAVSASRPPKNLTNDDEYGDSVVQYEPDANLRKDRGNETKLISYDLHENAIKDNGTRHEGFHVGPASGGNRGKNNTMEHEFHMHFTKDHRMTTRADYTKANVKNISVSHEFHKKFMKLEEDKNDLGASLELLREKNFTQNTNNVTLRELSGNFSKNDNENNTFPYEVCNDNVCIQLCCPLGERLINEKCVSENRNFSFPVYMTSDSSETKKRKLDEVFQLIVNDPCENGRYVLNPVDYPEDEYTVLANGSLYFSHYGEFLEFTTYCLAVVNGDQYEVSICFSNETTNTTDSEPQSGTSSVRVVGLIISLPFLLATFVVYSVLPELRNMHGYTLRGYVGSLFVGYMVLTVLQLINQTILPDAFCIALGTAYPNYKKCSAKTLSITHARVNYFLSADSNVILKLLR